MANTRLKEKDHYEVTQGRSAFRLAAKSKEKGIHGGSYGA